MIAQVARSEARSPSRSTFHPMMPGSAHEAISTDRAMPMPPGSAKRTTRLRNPGM